MVEQVLPGYASYSEIDKKAYNFGEGTKGLALIYFYKSMSIKDTAVSFQSKNIPDKKLWKEIEKRKGQIDMTNDIKMTSYFGFFNEKSQTIDSGYLIITYDGVIKKMYKNVCPEAIIDLLNDITEQVN